VQIKALVLDLVHNMDVVRQLEKAGARDVQDWAWQKQVTLPPFKYRGRGLFAHTSVGSLFAGVCTRLHTPCTCEPHPAVL
jgi:hypothetical protein